MSYIRVNLSDREKTISGEVHGSEGNALVAALSVEPETLCELEHGLSRFIKPRGEKSPFAGFAPFENFEPYDAGVLAIDLAARLIGCESTYFSPVREGELRYHDGNESTEIPARFRLAEEWSFVGSIAEFRGVSKRRRDDRSTIEPLDARKVLYGSELFEFLVGEMFDAPDMPDEELLADIHEKWLMTAREDLRQRSPREVLLEKHDLMDFDLFARELQWSFSGECPPFLSPDFHAYRFGGFGTHEIVVYYDLIRFLLEEIRKQNLSVEELEHLKNEWLETPDPESHGRTPAQIIDRERRRIPPAMSAEEAVIDHDCPVCQMMAEDFETPMFWHLDGCNMDNRFAFSFYKTREDWEAEQQRWEEMNEEFRRKHNDEFFDENDLIAGES